MKNIWCAFLIIFSGAFSQVVSSYEVITHENLSEKALEASTLGKPGVLTRLGLKEVLKDASQQAFPNSDATKQSINALFRSGARFEDNFPRSTHHFFNPYNGQALSLSGVQVGNPSPDWALEDKGQIVGGLVLGGQEYSYRDGRSYFYLALTSSSPVERDKRWGQMFQTLGQVIHHVQDMAQPQHVRNDQHLELEKGTEIVGCLAAPVACAAYLAIKTPSAYEAHTKIRGAQLLYSGYAPVYSQSDRQTFNTPRKFWHTENQTPFAGKGLAEFTNQNFVSAGTNFDAPGMFALPIKGNAIELDIKQLITNTTLKGTLTFWGSTVKDNYTGEVINNPLASTQSIFDADLKKKEKSPVYSLNRFNYDAANALLIPRAVGYSAGMINYFFRGDIDVVENTDLPGAYAIRNKGTETMTGTFGLYYDDAGEVRTLYKSWDLTIPAGAQASIGAIEPPTSPVPKKANQYLLVFSGDMGEETRAMFGTGAVTAAAVSLNPSSNALYLTGISATSVLVHMRVDRNGTRVVTAEEFHPLRSIFVGNPNATSKAYLTKQVEFLNDGKDYRTRAVIVGRPQFPMVSQGYVFHGDVANPNSADYFSCPYQLCWQGSTSSSSGEYLYLFSLNVLDYDQRAAGINYSRYRMVNGAPAVDRSGSVTLPPLPTGLVGLSYAAAGKGQLLVSPDGRTIVGFKGTDANQQQFHYELRLTMGDTVTAEWVQTIRDPYSDTPGPRATITPAGVRTVVFPDECVPKDPPRSYDLTLSQHTRNSEAVRSQASTVFFDYQNGNLLSLRSESSSKSIGQENYVSQDGTISGGVACSPEIWAAEKISGSSLYYVEQTNSSVVRNGTAVSVQTSAFARNREVLSSSIPYGWPRPPNFVVNYEYFGPLSGLNTPYQDNGPPVVPISGSYVLRALTSKLSDAIVLEMQAASQTIKIRDFVLPGGSGGPPPYVADASPLGELFFATSDLRVVIHDPRPNGIKQWVKPPSVVRLLGAVWM